MASWHAQLGFEHWVLDKHLDPKWLVCDLLGTPYATVSKIPSVKQIAFRAVKVLYGLEQVSGC